MDGSGYGLLLLAIAVLVIFGLVSLIGGLIYARITLGTRRGSAGAYAGWFAIYTVRFMARMTAAALLIGATTGNRLILVGIPASLLILFPSLWWRLLSAITGERYRPAATTYTRSPADQASDEQAADTLAAVRALVMVRGALPWTAGLTLVFGLGLSSSVHMPMSDWWESSYWDVSGSRLTSLMLVAAVAMIPAAAMGWVGWRRRGVATPRVESVVFERLEMPVAFVAAATWVGDIVYLGGSDVVHPYRHPFGGTIGLAALTAGHAFITVFLLTGHQALSGTGDPIGPRVVTARAPADLSRWLLPVASVGVIAVAAVVAATLIDTGSKTAEPILPVPTPGPPTTTAPVARPPPTGTLPVAPSPSVTGGTAPPTTAAAPTRTPYQAEVAAIRSEVPSLVVDMQQDVIWVDLNGVSADVPDELHGALANRVRGIRASLEAMNPPRELRAGHALLLEETGVLLEACDGMLDGLRLDEVDPDGAKSIRHQALSDFAEAAARFDGVAARVSDPRTPILTLDFPVGVTIFDPHDHDRVAGSVLNLTGTAPPGATIRSGLGEARAGADGVWLLPVELKLGRNAVTLELILPGRPDVTTVVLDITRVLEISAGGIEGIAFGSPLQEVEGQLLARLGLPRHTRVEGDLESEFPWYSKEMEWPDLDLRVLFDYNALIDGDGVVGLSGWDTGSPALMTKEGLSVGSTVTDLLDAYGARVEFIRGGCTGTNGFVIHSRPGQQDAEVLRGMLSGPSSDPSSTVVILAAGLTSRCY